MHMMRQQKNNYIYSALCRLAHQQLYSGLWVQASLIWFSWVPQLNTDPHSTKIQTSPLTISSVALINKTEPTVVYLYLKTSCLGCSQSWTVGLQKYSNEEGNHDLWVLVITLWWCERRGQGSSCVWGDRWALLLCFWRWGSKFHYFCVFVYKQKLEICRHIICPRLAQNNCGDFCLVKWVLGLHGHGVEGLPESTIVVTKEVVSLWFNSGFLCFASWQRFSGRLLHVGK